MSQLFPRGAAGQHVPWRAAVLSLMCLCLGGSLTGEARATAYALAGEGHSNSWIDTNGLNGTLLVNDANTSTFQTGGIFGGTGTVGGALVVESGATLAPGASPGLFTLAGGLAMQDGSQLVMEFTGGLPDLLIGDGYDLVVGTGFALVYGTRPGFDSGSFTNTTNLKSGLTWDVSALASGGVVSNVPEPGTVAMVVVGMGALLFRSRTRRV